MLDIPDKRLLSCRYLDLFSIPDAWTAARLALLPVNGDLIVDPNVQPEFDLRRHNWVLFIRFRTAQGRYVHLMHKWGFVESPACDCGADEQAMRHIVDETTANCACLPMV
jgi:hypothetical protein